MVLNKLIIEVFKNKIFPVAANINYVRFCKFHQTINHYKNKYNQIIYSLIVFSKVI